MADVIAAPATPPGRSALAVVRLSGDGCLSLAQQVVRAHSGQPWRARAHRRVDVCDREGVFDDGLMVWFEAPSSATGEDVVEITTHGNPVVVDRLMAALGAAGARLAHPGEFTRRAVMCGKVDLVAAEGVAATIDACTRAGLTVARQATSGAHRDAFNALQRSLAVVAAELEARLDLPGDDLALEDDDAVGVRLMEVRARCDALAATVSRGQRLVNGARVALVGVPNAGKSSLFNALVGRRRALVHTTPGTTRDVIEVQVRLAGALVTLLDTAGERIATDPVEAAGQALARELVDEADAIVLVLRAGADDAERSVETALAARLASRPVVRVYNGVDRPGVGLGPPDALATSATTGVGVDDLAGAIARLVSGDGPREGELVLASRRQGDRLRQVAVACVAALEALAVAGPAAAAALVTDALAALGELTGVGAQEAVLDEVFARFCVGK